MIDMQPEKCGDDLLQSIIKNEREQKENLTFTIAQDFQKASALFLKAKSKKRVKQKSNFLCILHRG